MRSSMPLYGGRMSGKLGIRLAFLGVAAELDEIGVCSAGRRIASAVMDRVANPQRGNVSPCPGAPCRKRRDASAQLSPEKLSGA